MSDLSFFEIRNARDSEETPHAMEQVFAALGGGDHKSIVSKLMDVIAPSQHSTFSFEIVSVNTRIHFFLVSPKQEKEYIESQMVAQYPKLLLSPLSDYAPHFFTLPHDLGQLILSSPFYIPIKTHEDVEGIDILSSVLGQFAKLPNEQAAALQICIESAGDGWKRTCHKVIEQGVPDPRSETGAVKSHPQAPLIEKKIEQAGFHAVIRLLGVSSNQAQAEGLVKKLSAAFSVYTLGGGNGLVFQKPRTFQKQKLQDAFIKRTTALRPRFQVLGSRELASLWHPPGESLSLIKNIAWGASLIGEAPENLPVATHDEEEKKNINFFARCEFKNKTVTFGIKKQDRRKHLYVIGKTGAGKSTLIANMAINDIRNGYGVGVIDPHGDLSDIMLDYIPSYRINDVAYLDPSDTENPFRLNPLEVTNQAHREIVASGIVSIFHKLYSHSWGPRLEYILRNTILTLLLMPNTTLLQVPELLANEKYRQKVIDKLEDNVMKNYWLQEYNKMSEKLRVEAISPILNKVGQFLSVPTIRNILGHHKSTVNLRDMMDQGKIVIVNLSQGKIGEDNSALLGAMLITKMQLAAMSRVYQEEEKRRDFYLYVDEFQNFATDAFVKILSEARKYRLNLMLANQYIGQIDEEVQKAIFGNVGSLVSFGVGAQDASLLVREFGGLYKEEELVGLGNYEVVVKLSIDNQTSRPFSAKTLPLPRSKNQNREKILRSSKERYTKKIS